MALVGVADGIVRTYRKAVETDHAPRRVDHVIRQVYAMRFAHVLALAALYALVGVDVDVENGIARNETESGAHRTYGIAEQPAGSAGDYRYDCHGDHRNYESEHRSSGNLEMYVGFSYACRSVAGPADADRIKNRTKHIGTKAAVYAPGINERNYERQTGDEKHQHDCNHCVAQLVGRLAVMIVEDCAVSAHPGQSGADVLKSAERTNRGAVDPSENKGCGEPDYEICYGKRHGSGEELYLLHPRCESRGEETAFHRGGR